VAALDVLHDLHLQEGAQLDGGELALPPGDVLRVGLQGQDGAAGGRVLDEDLAGGEAQQRAVAPRQPGLEAAVRILEDALQKTQKKILEQHIQDATSGAENHYIGEE